MFCMNCESEFDEGMEEVRYEYGEAWGSPYLISHKKCPYCGDDQIIEDNNYHYCDCCGDVCQENYIKTEDGSYFCENCYTIKNIYDER